MTVRVLFGLASVAVWLAACSSFGGVSGDLNAALEGQRDAGARETTTTGSELPAANPDSGSTATTSVAATTSTCSSSECFQGLIRFTCTRAVGIGCEENDVEACVDEGLSHMSDEAPECVDAFLVYVRCLASAPLQCDAGHVVVPTCDSAQQRIPDQCFSQPTTPAPRRMSAPAPEPAPGGVQ